MDASSPLSRTSDPEVVVVGTGPNGLAAAVFLLLEGINVEIYEAEAEPGGGLRSGALSEPGYIHDHCAAIHPMGILSPFFRTLPLVEHGLCWKSTSLSVAHPLDKGPAVLLGRDRLRLSETLGSDDAKRWERLFAPFVESGPALLCDLMGPLPLLPRRPLSLLRFGLMGLRGAEGFARAKFQGERARALFAGLAGHSLLPLTHVGTAAFGLIFGMTAGLCDWPCVEGGSAGLARALIRLIESLGGKVHLNRRISRLSELPSRSLLIFDLTPKTFLEVTQGHFSSGYVKRLNRYKYGPGTFKVDYTLDGPIPWTDSRVAEASTVHVGGTLAEIAKSEHAAFYGSAPENPYLIVCQQSSLDPGRAPAGKHTGYAYCHVPAHFSGDATDVISRQIERFAPGFRDLIRTSHSTSPAAFEAQNPNFVGGAVTGGSATWDQLFTRPLAQLDPYRTPDPRLFLCSASTPPGGGVHGMCGYYAARSALRRLGRRTPQKAQLSLAPLAPLPRLPGPEPLSRDRRALRDEKD